MERIAAGALGQRVHREAAGRRVAGHDDALPGRKVLARLLVAPGRGALGQGNQSRLSVLVTADAAGMSWTLGEKDRLNAGLEIFVVERRCGTRACRRRRVRTLDPGGDRLPLGVVLAR